MRTEDASLRDVIVVDLGQIYNGPYATLLMALAGADVIKIEPPGGEHLRNRGKVAGAGAPFVMLNSNKRGVTLDLKHPDGVELFEEMVRRADVVVENFRPGVMERLGLSTDRLLSLNPRLVVASGSGFGRTGPYRDYAAMDLTIQAMSGVMAVTGFEDREPVKAGPAISDFLAGIHLYGAVVTALYRREITGRGGSVEVSMLESVYPTLTSSLGLHLGATSDVPTRTGNRHAGLAESPYNAYPTDDGHLAVICVSDAHWRALCQLMGRPELGDDPAYASRVERVARMDEVDELVTDFTAGRSTQDLFKLLREAGVPCAPVREIAEVVADPHLRERGMITEIDHPELGEVTVPTTPLRIDDRCPEVTRSPLLGEHNEAVYCRWLGVDAHRFAQLREQGVV